MVAVDTNTLHWAVRKQGSSDKITHARYLFQELERDKAQIIVPSIVVAEYIIPVPPNLRSPVVAKLGQRFIIEPFDAKDATLAAKLWDYGKAHRNMGAQNSRTTLRADTLIVATAVNHGATEFYTDDADCLALAKTVMVAKPLPTIPPDLFSYGDDQEEPRDETQEKPEAGK